MTIDVHVEIIYSYNLLVRLRVILMEYTAFFSLQGPSQQFNYCHIRECMDWVECSHNSVSWLHTCMHI